jgi:hypothetical protein
MSFFNSREPWFRSKQSALDIQDLTGLWKIDWQFGSISLSAAYTRVDQAFLIWGVIAAIIFTTAQFSPWSWQEQASVWTLLTLVGTISMVNLTQFWAKVEQLSWVIYLWATLMLAGMGLTDLSITFGWGGYLMRLCPIWLGLCAIGYIGSGLGLGSRALVLTGGLHIAAIPLLIYLSAWQFLTTAIVIAGSLMLLAICQWDMRLPIEYTYLTAEQNVFNKQQYALRKSVL